MRRNAPPNAPNAPPNHRPAPLDSLAFARFFTQLAARRSHERGYRPSRTVDAQKVELQRHYGRCSSDFVNNLNSAQP